MIVHNLGNAMRKSPKIGSVCTPFTLQQLYQCDVTGFVLVALVLLQSMCVRLQYHPTVVDVVFL